MRLYMPKAESKKFKYNDTWVGWANTWFAEPTYASYQLYKRFSPAGAVATGADMLAKGLRAYEYDNLAAGAQGVSMTIRFAGDPVTTTVAGVISWSVGSVADYGINEWYNHLTDEQKADPANVEMIALVKTAQLWGTSIVASKAGNKVKNSGFGEKVTKKWSAIKEDFTNTSDETSDNTSTAEREETSSTSTSTETSSKTSTSDTSTTESVDSTSSAQQAEDVRSAIQESIPELQEQLSNAEAKLARMQSQRETVTGEIQKLLNQNRSPGAGYSADQIYEQAAEYGHDMSLKKSGDTPRFVKGSEGVISLGKRGGGKPHSFSAPKPSAMTALESEITSLKSTVESLSQAASTADTVASTLSNQESAQAASDAVSNEKPSSDTSSKTDRTGGSGAAKKMPAPNASTFTNDKSQKDYRKKRKAPPGHLKIWLDDTQLSSLLDSQFANNDDVRVLAPIDGVTLSSGNNQFKSQLQQYIDYRRKNSLSGDRSTKLIMPISLGNDPSIYEQVEHLNKAGFNLNNLQVGNHWVLAYVEFTKEEAVSSEATASSKGPCASKKSTTPMRIVYINSMQSEIHRDIQLALKGVLGSVVPIENLSHTKQKDTYTCGDWVIAAAKSLVTGKDTPRDDDDLDQIEIYHQRNQHMRILAAQGLLSPNHNQAPAKDESQMAKESEAIARADATESENKELRDHLAMEKARTEKLSEEKAKLEKENVTLKTSSSSTNTSTRRRRRRPSATAKGTFFNSHKTADKQPTPDDKTKKESGDSYQPDGP